MSFGPRRAPRQTDLEIRGLRHRFTWWGEPSADPIVLLHGWMDAGPTWQFLVDCLPDSWSCVAPDWRGFGGSAWAPDGYWFPEYFADLEAMLDALVPDRPARVVGHSMGGNIVTMYAGIRPQRLAWLVNLDGVGLARTSPDRAPGRYADWLDQLRNGPRDNRYPSVEQFAKMLRARNPRLEPETAEFVARAWTRPAAEGVTLAADPRHRLLNPVLYRREESEACWKRIIAPLLVVFGEHSDHRTHLGADGTDEYFRSIFRTACFETVAGVGHMMHHEDPRSVARCIVEFAARHEEARRQPDRTSSSA